MGFFNNRNQDDYEHVCDVKCACGADAKVSRALYMGYRASWEIKCSDPDCPVQFVSSIFDSGERAWHEVLRKWNERMGDKDKTLLDSLVDVKQSIEQMNREIREIENHRYCERLQLLVPIPFGEDSSLRIKILPEDVDEIINHRRAIKDRLEKRAVKLAQLLANYEIENNEQE